MNLQGNRYLFEGGVDPLELVQKYDCPLYVCDTSIMKRQYKRLINAFDVKKIKINYACKALTNLGVLKYLRIQEKKKGL